MSARIQPSYHISVLREKRRGKREGRRKGKEGRRGVCDTHIHNFHHAACKCVILIMHLYFCTFNPPKVHLHTSIHSVTMVTSFSSYGYMYTLTSFCR